MFNLLESYLDYILEANAYTKRAAAGTLSGNAAKRLRDSGVVRPLEQYKAGYARGTKNIVARAGYQIEDPENDKGPRSKDYKTRSKAAKVMGALTFPGDKKINMGIGGKNEIVKRHEANEAGAMEKRLKKGQLPVGNIIGAHATPKILKNEEKDTNTIITLYGDKKTDQFVKDARGIRALRKLTGEYDVANNISKGDYRKLHRKGINPLDMYEPKNASTTDRVEQVMASRKYKPSNFTKQKVMDVGTRNVAPNPIDPKNMGAIMSTLSNPQITKYSEDSYQRALERAKNKK